jgi:hypothetical protein
MAIINYTSDKPIEKIFAELQHTLGTYGAKHISFEYGDDGKVEGVAFTVKVNDRFLPIKLPARVKKAQAVLKKRNCSGGRAFRCPRATGHFPVAEPFPAASRSPSEHGPCRAGQFLSPSLPVPAILAVLFP